MASEPETTEAPPNFVRDRIAADVEAGQQRVCTRFPPEPNGYLHVGHAKSICLNFTMAAEFGGHCNLRFDDTNPETEDTEYVESIQDDIRWLGFDWGDNLYYASDYFQQLYDWAVQLVKAGKAYVDSQDAETIRAGRGDFHRPGVDSPFRDRSVEENLDLLGRMKDGEFDEGEHVLRAKIDMASPNLNFRDPLMYRIRRVTHHRTGDDWCIYPMYDYAHGQSDAIETITHSICTLEFQDHRPLYEWFLDALELPKPVPQQIEFARLNLTYTVLSKRKLLELVRENHVGGWDDPRMPTIRGMRRRGIPAAAIRNFCERVGVARRDGVVDVTLFEHSIRTELNATSPRVMGVLNPLKLVIENFDAEEVVWIDAPYDPNEPEGESRQVPLTRELWVESTDFRKEAPKKWWRLAPGKEVRLRYGCLVTCTGFEEDDAGNVTELRCTWDPESKGGTSPDGRRVRGTIHWVSAAHAVQAQVRLYDRLFDVENPNDPPEGKHFTDLLNPNSVEVKQAWVERSMAYAEPGHRVQLERVGYFVVDDEATAGTLVLNRTIALRDSWAKIEKKLGKKKSG